MATVYLGLGTNLGDRPAALRAAVASLAPAVAVTAVSPVYESAPMYVADQPQFLNLVLRGETGLAPDGLLAALKALEAMLGRASGGLRNGPRVIDLDILYYDRLILATAVLTIPHPRLAERAFVLCPLADLAPTLVHPALGRSTAALAAALPDTARAEVRRVPVEIAPPNAAPSPPRTDQSGG